MSSDLEQLESVTIEGPTVPYVALQVCSIHTHTHTMRCNSCMPAPYVCAAPHLEKVPECVLSCAAKCVPTHA